MKKYLIPTVSIAIFIAITSCATVDVTKTGKGYFSPTDPNDIEILLTIPQRPYVELGTLTVDGYDIQEEAKMHNAIRAKAAPLGANAVIIQNQGILKQGWGGGQRWATGVAIRYK
jgi:hypothetical protein